VRVLVGGVGYRFLRDGSLGPLLIERLEAEGAPANGIELEDLSYGPVALSHNLRDRPPYDRLVLIAAVQRGRPVGTVHTYRWDGVLPDAKEIQQRVGEAVTGVISLDNLLIVCTALGGMPDDVRVIEFESVDEDWGEGFSPELEARMSEIVEAVWSSTAP
jgi:hydrogenase maturation protease